MDLSSAGAGGNATGNPALECYDNNLVVTNGIWMEKEPERMLTQYAFPIFMIQLLSVVLLSRAIYFLLRPLNQPRVVAEILCGVVMGPSVVGRIHLRGDVYVRDILFVPKRMLTAETMANLGIIYFLFSVGVGLDFDCIRRSTKKAATIAFVNILLPFMLVAIVGPPILTVLGGFSPGACPVLTLSIVLCVTSVPTLARILTENRLLNTDIGRLAMLSATINRLIIWGLVALSMGVSGNANDHLSLRALGVLFSGVFFVLFCMFVLQPALQWLPRRLPDAKQLDPVLSGIIILLPIAGSALTEIIGVQAALGALTVGLAVPGGPFSIKVLEIIEESCVSYLTSLYFACSGFRTDAADITSIPAAGAILTVFLLASGMKIAGTIGVTWLYGMPLRQGVSLGFLMNTRGIIQMLVINLGFDKDEELNKSTFPVLVLASLATTMLVTPAVKAAERKSVRRRLGGYRRRNVQMVRPETELRVLACIHSVKNVAPLISLLDAAYPTKRSPIFIYALHLMELIGRASAMLVSHPRGGSGKLRPSSNVHAESEHIISAFERYEQHAGGVSVQPVTAIASYSMMHGDIRSVAEDYRVALILIPYAKQLNSSSADAPTSSRTLVARNVLASAPCSVAVLVNRGMSTAGTHRTLINTVVLLFVGGPDDREALAFASRMADHPDITLSIIRFVSDSASADAKVDDRCIEEFRMRHVKKTTVAYTEKKVNDCEDTVAVIRSIENTYDLYVVGRGKGVATPVTAGLEDWNESPELGTIGDLLASSDFGREVSVLVFQQYVVPAAVAAAADSEENPSGRDTETRGGRCGSRRLTWWPCNNV